MNRGAEYLCLVVALVVSLLLIAVASADQSDGDQKSSVEIPNSPVEFILNISNFSWEQNTNLTDAFNISQHFFDANGDELTYFANTVSPFNITVVINATTGMVSFYPDPGFSGERNLTFTATDGASNATSNVVFLFVGLDNESPTWHDPGRGNGEDGIDQNEFISFWTTWRDNYALSSYVFSIEQDGLWTNQSAVSFSGVENLSNVTVQISAAPGSTVRWRFYAWDTSGNMNVTDIFTFTVNSLPSTGGGGGGSGGGGGGGSGGGGGGGGGSSSGGVSGSVTAVSSILEQLGVDIRSPYDFTIVPSALDIELLQGDERTYVLTVKNTGINPLNLSILLFGVDSFINLSTTTLNLDPTESKDFLLDVSVPKSFTPGQYIGRVQVNGTNVSKSVPIVTTIKHFDPFLLFNLSIPDNSKLVRPGRSVLVDVNITQKDYVKDLDATLYLSIKDFDGFLFATIEKEVKVPLSTQFFEELEVPVGSSEGPYLVYGRIEFEDKYVIDSERFEVGFRFKLESFLQYSGLILIVFIIAFIFIILIIRYERTKRKEKLLQLYLLLSQMKGKLTENDLAGAGDLYVRIKHVYGEPVPKEVLHDREFLKQELVRFSKVISQSRLAQEVEKDEEAAEGEGGESKEGEASGESKSSEEKPAEEGSEEVKAEGSEVKPAAKPAQPTTPVAQPAATSVKPSTPATAPVAATPKAPIAAQPKPPVTATPKQPITAQPKPPITAQPKPSVSAPAKPAAQAPASQPAAPGKVSPKFAPASSTQPAAPAQQPVNKPASGGGAS